MSHTVLSKYPDAYLGLSHTSMRCFFAKHKRFIVNNRQGPAYDFATKSFYSADFVKDE